MKTQSFSLKNIFLSLKSKLNNKKSIFFKSLTVLMTVSGVALLMFSFFPKSFNLNFGKTSVISNIRTVNKTIQNTAEKIPVSKSCDLGIKNINIIKKASKEGIKHFAQVVLVNNGESLTKADVELTINNDQKIHISNIGNSLSLMAGKDFIVDDIELDFDENYNGNIFNFVVSVNNSIDINPDNDTYSTEILNESPSITDIFIDNVLQDNKLSISFNNSLFPASLNKYEFFVAKNIKFNDSFGSYHEFSDKDGVYEYTVIPNKKEYIDSFFGIDVSENDAHFLNFDKNKLKNNNNYALFIKATNLDTNEFAFTDVIVFRKNTEMTKEDFAKFMVKEFNIKINKDLTKSNDPVYSDLDVSNENYIYIETLYNLGLLDTEAHNFFPEQYITRGQAIKIIIDYLDIPLTTSDKIDVNDIIYKSNDYYYAATLLENDVDHIFTKYLNLELPATKHFVNYLINEYPQNN